MRVVVPPGSSEDSGASESFQIPPYPRCSGCGRHPHVHARRGANLFCDVEKGSPKGDFGPHTPLVVASVYADIGLKLPEGLRNEVVRLRNEGITSW